MGLPVGEHYVFSANQNHAQNLQGKLLLMHGDMDENVHVASTLVVVDGRTDQSQQRLRPAYHA